VRSWFLRPIFGHIVAVLADEVLVVDPFVAQQLLEVGEAQAQVGDAVDDVTDQVATAGTLSL
jgi:hypothetical protein